MNRRPVLRIFDSAVDLFSAGRGAVSEGDVAGGVTGVDSSFFIVEDSSEERDSLSDCGSPSTSESSESETSPNVREVRARSHS